MGTFYRRDTFIKCSFALLTKISGELYNKNKNNTNKICLPHNVKKTWITPEPAEFPAIRGSKKLILERTELIIEASKIKKEINTSFLGCNYVPCLPSSGGFLYIFSYELPSQRIEKTQKRCF